MADNAVQGFDRDLSPRIRAPRATSEWTTLELDCVDLHYGLRRNHRLTCQVSATRVSRQVEDRRAKFPVSAHHQLGPYSLCSYLKHDLAWSMFCGAMFEGFACAGERQHFGYHRL